MDVELIAVRDPYLYWELDRVIRVTSSEIWYGITRNLQTYYTKLVCTSRHLGALEFEAAVWPATKLLTPLHNGDNLFYLGETREVYPELDQRVAIIKAWGHNPIGWEKADLWNTE